MLTMTHATVFFRGYFKKRPCGFMALWPYVNKFDNWPVGAHVIRFAIGVDKYKPYMLLRASSMVYSAQYSVK